MRPGKSTRRGDPPVFRHKRGYADDREVPIVRHRVQSGRQESQPDFFDRAEDLWDSFISGRPPTIRRRNVPLADQGDRQARRRMAEKAERGHDAPRKTSAVQAFFRDGVVRTALLVCAFVMIGSGIAIPTAFAQPTTDITINDGGRILSLSTAAGTVGECLADNKIQLGPDDMLAQDASAAVTPGMEIKIWRATQVTVSSGDSSMTLSMVSGTVGDALAAAGVHPEELDEVYPSVDTPIRAGMRIDHIRVTKEQTRQTYDIPYESIEREDPDLWEGDTRLVQGGEVGQFEIVTEIIYKNGVVYSQKVLSEETIKEPVDEITAVGTYVPPPPPVEDTPTINEIHSQQESGGSSGSGGSPSSGGAPGGSSGDSGDKGGSSGSGSSGGSSSGSPGGTGETIDGMNVKYSLNMQVTAYCKACDSGNGRTASGTYAQWGTVAANTGVLPFGTKLYIPGYGYGVVEDTGGFGSNVVDVYLGDRSTCTCGSDWGRQNLTIYVLN